MALVEKRHRERETTMTRLICLSPLTPTTMCNEEPIVEQDGPIVGCEKADRKVCRRSVSFD
jgi:hypothetical protein